jgi:hypothetical protein
MATWKPKSDGQAKKVATRKSSAQSKKVGRPRAKHSSPDYKQMSVYIHKDVRSKVKARLFETDGEFSGLVESLLQGWLNRQR